MIYATIKTSAVLSFDDAQVGDQVLVAGASSDDSVITRKTARRIYVTHADGSTSHINASSRPGRLRINLTKHAITTTPADTIHARRLASSNPALRMAQSAARQTIATHDLNDPQQVKNLNEDLERIASLALAAFDTTTQAVRHMVTSVLTQVAQERYENITDQVKFIDAVSDLYSAIAPTSTATDTWQITTENDDIIGHVNAPDTDTAITNARKTFTHAQLKNGFSLRRLTEAELTERGL